jgi:hypothetical protein
MPVLKNDAPVSIKRPMKRKQYRPVDCLSTPMWALIHIWGYSKSDINAKTGIHNSYITWIDKGTKSPNAYHEERFVSMLYATIKQAEKLKLKAPYSKINSMRINATKIIIRESENSR